MGVIQLMQLEGLGLGQLGYSFRGKEAEHRLLTQIVRQDDAFATIDGLHAVCIDSRLWEKALRVPGGGLMLAYMWHYLTEEPLLTAYSRLCHLGMRPRLHQHCAFVGLGVEFVQKVLDDPREELRLLRRLGYVEASESVESLRKWAVSLPADFMVGYEELVGMYPEGEQRLLGAVINKHSFATFSQQQQVQEETGLGVLSVDMWAGKFIAERMTNDSRHHSTLTDMALLLTAATLRRLGSRHLRLLIHE